MQMIQTRPSPALQPLPADQFVQYAIGPVRDQEEFADLPLLPVGRFVRIGGEVDGYTALMLGYSRYGSSGKPCIEVCTFFPHGASRHWDLPIHATFRALSSLEAMRFVSSILVEAREDFKKDVYRALEGDDG